MLTYTTADYSKAQAHVVECARQVPDRSKALADALRVLDHIAGDVPWSSLSDDQRTIAAYLTGKTGA